MNSKKLMFVSGVLLLSLSFAIPIWGQNSGATLSGTITDQSGSPVANAKVSVSNIFSGRTAHYNNVPFKLVPEGREIRVVGTIPTTVSDFKIKPPELLAMPINNNIPVDVDMTWKEQ